MLSVLLTILKILGIILLVLSGIILSLLLLVLFVPVRYRITVHRKTKEEDPVVADIKATWLLHILNAAFSYPRAAFVRIRIFCFTVFCSNRPPKASKPEKKEPAGKRKEKKEGVKQKAPEPEKEAAREKAQKENSSRDGENPPEEKTEQTKQLEQTVKKKRENKVFEFFGRLWHTFKNIKYTITRICDKIKHIVRNIQYYLKIIKSDTFHRAWEVCSGQVFSLLKSILPGKIRGNLLIGTGDPAGTGQVLAIYGIFYPLLGNHIDIVPDFEQQILEGDLLMKGKITVFRALKTAWIVYFNKDLRRLIKLFKREAV